jgi:hypothetical protein
MSRSLMNGLGQVLGWRSTNADDDQPSNTRDRREGTRIGLAIGIEVPRPGSDEATIFAGRLVHPLPLTTFDYPQNAIYAGPVKFVNTRVI